MSVRSGTIDFDPELVSRSINPDMVVCSAIMCYD